MKNKVRILKQILRKTRRLAHVIAGRDVLFPVQVRVSKERFGSEYGGWCVASDYLRNDAIVYSFGIGTDISFDLEIIAKYGVSVFAFDPTPKSIEWVKAQAPPHQFRLQEYGLADHDGTVAFYPPNNPAHISHTILNRSATADQAIEVNVFRLKTILERLGHQRLDVLKMDIEGAEYSVIDDILASSMPVGQICVEFHHGMDGISAAMTKAAIQALNLHGFLIFDVSATGAEYSFIHSSLIAPNE